MGSLVVLAGVGIIAVSLAALYITLVIGIRRGDKRKLDNGPDTMARRALLTVCSAGERDGEH